MDSHGALFSNEAKLNELFNRSTESAHPTHESVALWNPIAFVVQQKYPPAGLPLASTARYRSAESLAQCGLALMRCWQSAVEGQQSSAQLVP